MVLEVLIWSTERVCRVSKYVALGRKARKAYLTIVPEIVVDLVRVLDLHGITIPARCERLMHIVAWVARCLRHVQVLIWLELLILWYKPRWGCDRNLWSRLRQM